MNSFPSAHISTAHSSTNLICKLQTIAVFTNGNLPVVLKYFPVFTSKVSSSEEFPHLKSSSTLIFYISQYEGSLMASTEFTFIPKPKNPHDHFLNCALPLLSFQAPWTWFSLKWFSLLYLLFKSYLLNSQYAVLTNYSSCHEERQYLICSSNDTYTKECKYNFMSKIENQINIWLCMHTKYEILIAY